MSELTKSQKAKKFWQDLKDMGVIDYSTHGMVGTIWVSEKERAYKVEDLDHVHLVNIIVQHKTNDEEVPHLIELEFLRREEERKREYGVHKAHCFMVVDGEFMGCKYGDDKKCPMYKERPTCPHEDNILYGKTLKINKQTRVVNMFCTTCESFGTVLELRDKNDGEHWYEAKENWHEMSDYKQV